MTVDELCKVERGQVISKAFLRDHPGSYPVYSSQTENNGIFGYIDSYAYDHESLTWTTDGANAGSIFYHNGKKFSITNVCGLLSIKDPEIVDTRFLGYSLKIHAPRYVSSGMGNPKLMAGTMKQIKIPIPPLSEQRRIADILDKFDALVNDISSGLPAEIAARRKQYEYYRDQLLSFPEAR